MKPFKIDSDDKGRFFNLIIIIINVGVLVGILSFVFIKISSSQVTKLKTDSSSDSRNQNSVVSEDVPVSADRLSFLIENNKLDQAQTAITKSVQANDTDPFNLYLYSFSLFQIGNKEQATFVFYLAQIRTRAYSRLDPDKSASSALRASFNDEVGSSVNPWAGSDLDAWKQIALKAVAYDKKIGYPKKPKFVDSEEKWRKAVDTESAAYEAELIEFFATTNKEDFNKQRKENSLPIGPWENPGPALPSEWQ